MSDKFYDAVVAAKYALKGLGKTSADTAEILYGKLLETPETEQEYLLRRLNMLLNGPHPGPADYGQVREDRRKWDGIR